MNTSTDYAIRILIYLAEKNGVTASAEISQHLSISQRYLLQVAAKLRDGNLVNVAMGPEGGYRLTAKPEEITMYDVIMLMEGTTFLVPSSATAEEEIRENHTINYVYQLLQSIWDAFLRGVSLDTMVNKPSDQIKAFTTEQLAERLHSIVAEVAEKMCYDI